MKWIRVILFFPFALLYDVITSIRNMLFDLGITRSYGFDVPLINVGNLSAGGTGKTPVSAYFIELLQSKGLNVAYLSRGYKRQGRGFLKANINSNAQELGDEAYLIAQRYDVIVAVCEDRVEGVRKLMSGDDSPDVVILDDAFQHRRIKAGLNILLDPYSDHFYDDFLLPAGNLRESSRFAKRADIVVVTKVPEGVVLKENPPINKLKKHFREDALFYARIKYQQLRHFKDPGQTIDTDKLSEYAVLLVTGIGNAKQLEKYLEGRAGNLGHMEYRDHHNFSQTELQKIVDRFQKIPTEKKLILTTEKDISRLINAESEKIFQSLPLYYIPIRYQFHQLGTVSFDQKILDYVGKN